MPPERAEQSGAGMVKDVVGDHFPDTYRDLSTRRLLDVFRRGPERLRRVVAGLETEALRARPRPDHWSIQENVIHVVDSEIVGAVRFRIVLAEPGRPLPFYSQDAWTEALGYQAYDAGRRDAALDHFEVLRSTSSSLLRTVDDDGWRRAGVHAELGPVTLRQLLELYADHGEWHIWRILDLRRRLGDPLDVPLLLPRRLFPVRG